MELWEIFIIGVALAMDAVATSLANGMAEPRMRALKMLVMAGAFGLFQFGMPLIGYYCSAAFASLVEKIAPYLSFVLLGFIGGKMIFDAIREGNRQERTLTRREKRLGGGELVMQAIATSLDALAVGVTLLATETTAGLPYHAVLCTLVIGVVTFALSLAAVFIGKKAGALIADKAEILGGVVLIFIGVKLLLEGVL